MAEVEKDESIESNFEDDLDKMLQDTVEQLDDVSSQEAIDKLLSADDDDVSSEKEIDVNDLVDSLLDESVQDQAADVIDEFGEDPAEPEALKTKDAASELVDDLCTSRTLLCRKSNAFFCSEVSVIFIFCIA
jgi:hypothetical protein